MSNTLQSRLTSVADLLNRNDHEEALVAVESISLRTIEGLGKIDYSEYYYLYARCLFRRGEYGRALSKLRGALRLCQLTADHVLYANEKHLMGLIYRAQGRTQDAIETFVEALVSRKRARDYPGICGSLVGLGLSHFEGGDLTQARDVLADALSYARKYNTAAEVRVCNLNRCLVTLFSGDLNVCRSILDEIRSGPLGVMDIAHVRQHSGQRLVLLLEYEDARENLKDAATVYARSHIKRDQTVCLEFLGMNEFFQGNYGKAKEYYQQVFDMPEPTASAVAQTLRMLTDVYIAEGNWDKAKETAIAAKAAITKINERIELAALWRAQAQIAEHDRDHDVARDFFQKSIDLLQQCGARYELALTHFAAGQSTVHSSASRSEHLQRAKTLFVEMDVPKRVSQVEKAIVQLTSMKLQPKVFRNGKNSIETPDIITQDPEMLRILADAKRFADTDMTVLITGETGTGKDLLAKYIHCHSKRAAGPFCNENMSRFPRELIDSELFGYEKGSHSRADRNKAGVIELADGGTFCLNEIVELPLDMQARLLQVIEEGTMRRVGGGLPRPVDVRFIAMTNGDLEERVEARLFRQDLFYRLQGLHLHLPPLRARNGDLPLLLQRFLKQLGFGSFDLRETTLIVEHCGFAVYDWPGNVRELRGVLKKAVTLTPSRLLAELVGRLKVRMDQLLMVDSDNAERAKFLAALKRNSGCQTSAAKELGIPVSTLRNKLRKYRII
ncbi:MAG: sigma 54-interacting transcriptional regulator [candidate division Zixibacteria bacterium]|nr:sigma 54-interacting transcriptional regulator [candidate division Zixibacteria bacterium]